MLPVHKLCICAPAAPSKQPVVLVCCGSFNPPTVLHVKMFELAQQKLVKMGYEVLGGYMSPVADAYEKPTLVAAKHRVAMCELAASTTSNIMVDSWESQQPGYTRTLKVLEHVSSELHSRLQPTCEPELLSRLKVMLLCGADLLATMAKPGVWVQPEVILQDYGVVCLERDGTDVEGCLTSPGNVVYENQQHVVRVHDPEQNTVSSTKVREALQEDRPVSDFVHDAVLDYIRQHGLYSVKHVTKLD